MKRFNHRPSAENNAYDYSSSVIQNSLDEQIAWVPPSLAGERLDKALARLFPDFSRSRLQMWIDAGRVTLDGAPARLRQPVLSGSTVRLVPDQLPEVSACIPEPVPLPIVYEDDTLLVIDKPAGLVVHPAAGNWCGTLLNGLLHRYPHAAELPRAGIVHRLDKDTSGVMVVARTLAAQTNLVRQLQARTVKRYYIALSWGITPLSGCIDAPIGRDPRERTRMAVLTGGAGKAARTRFKTVATGVWSQQSISKLHCDLDTGRTHQIRVHLAHIGHPLLGDLLYSRGLNAQKIPALPAGFARQALHARMLELVHPATHMQVAWRSTIPQDLAQLVSALKLADTDESAFT
ncbi:RluA family pseudouridine synthase [Candidatus Vallotia cooleyia]|uniref:RluA family pseudouridine synthase n=1 Tax=Candidatus Vallotiella adelgis TaxID=1177211 RepID=UPI001D0062F7|nr:RluA family pseudouridine synthase [Candidatus Vallotia cooleyia]UDG81946.1 Ribosomal large subunit pseudouridine synthase D [Candidatus Vallotia cooleyia]